MSDEQEEVRSLESGVKSFDFTFGLQALDS
jgi:hypothetical protein